MDIDIVNPEAEDESHTFQTFSINLTLPICLSRGVEGL